MEIEVKKTIEISQEEWHTYTRSFNNVFQKEFKIDDFKHKYLNTIDGFSFHSLLKHDQLVVGSCTIIPFEYNIKSECLKVGLVVDVFISKEFRDDPFALYKMYNKLKVILVLHNIVLIVAVPNDTVYSYWKNVVKWKDIGLLKYYIHPIRLGNTLSILPKILNTFSFIFSKFLLFCSNFCFSKEKESVIRINRTNSILEKQRYSNEHRFLKIEETAFSYRIVNEKNILTCYLIDFYNTISKQKDAHSLRKAINFISKNERTDLIIFVGKISFIQLLLFRVPFRSEPKHLYLMAEILNLKISKYEDIIFDIKNWDFGIFNYDVR